MGLSRKYAGEKLYSEVLEVCQQFQEENSGKVEDLLVYNNHIYVLG